MRFDTHVHTTLSPCSNLTLSQIFAEARQRNLDGVCITDHETIEVQHMVKVLLGLDEMPLPDAADALGIALCHSHTRAGLARMRVAQTALRVAQ